MPKVIGTVWKNQGGTAAAIVAANWSDTAQTVRFHLPVRGFAVRHVKGEPNPDYCEEGNIGVAVLPPASIAFLSCSCR